MIPLSLPRFVLLRRINDDIVSGSSRCGSRFLPEVWHSAYAMASRIALVSLTSEGSGGAWCAPSRYTRYAAHDMRLTSVGAC